MKERIGYYDIARGLGIIFVVIGHIGTFYGPFRSFIITFHMALFFMISGMLIFETREEERSLTEIIKKKFFRIMVPYILFSVLSIIIEFVRLSLQDIYFWPHFRALFVTAGSFYGNSVMWFLPALFISEIIFLIIRRIKKDIVTVLSVLALAALTIWANTLPPVGNQFLQSFTAAMIRGVYCTIFICIGYYVRKYIMTLKIQNFVYGCWAILLTRLSLALNQFNPKVDLRAMYWGERGIATTSKTVLVSYQAALYLAGAVSGALGIIFLCKCLGKKTLIFVEISTKIGVFFFLSADIVDHFDVLLGEFGVVEPLEGAVGEIDLVHAAAAQREDGVDLLHHVDVVQAI